ncbi:hypothetical protein MHAE_17473 [Mycobacterium haemophilum DSM 44634]|uniref:DUF2510 domain-containing protein n=1 Tax=Mycobacterium haemophilum TaxID=29311 RepID=UPI000A777066|nr:DUF2510 domain-containing protein [Mycobacterium haemophilum]MCV7341311.1 DUF2510 domain-containing protein [Mycobacterium haemophilum DSM 44634]
MIDLNSCPPGSSVPPSPAAARGVRRVWDKTPAGLRLVVPVALLLIVVVVGFQVWTKSSRADWSRLPSKLICQVQSGSTPPSSMTVASVDVTHPRSNVLQLAVRFAQPLPPSLSTDSQTAGWVGAELTYTIANNGTKFVQLGPQQSADGLSITAIQGTPRTDKVNVRPDNETHAARTAPDTVGISLDLAKLGITDGLVNPGLTISSWLTTPPSAAARYAAQICHG